MMNVEDYEFPDDLYYEKNHFWGKILEDGNILFGATDYFQKMAGEIVFIELPMKGAKVEQGKSVSSLESGKWVGRVFVPFSGEIIEVNSELEDSPELINESCYNEGWIAKIKPSKVQEEIANLMKTGPDFEEFMKEEIQKNVKK
ncbi:MAG: glycine cleavage system protein GcvH [Actinobacteria bacterium]|nr:glycine cleavage system protein GcvH [Actinomycetota bacterium]MCL6088444.1 glycine cleavage system protein GcvH [Actinomycetota bacterium]